MNVARAIRSLVGLVPWLDTLLKAGRLPVGRPARRHLEQIGGPRLFNRVGDEYGIHPALLWGIARRESNFNPTAVGPAPIYAKGLMQLTDANVEGYGVGDWRDPLQNLRGGAQDLIAKGIKRDRELGEVLAAYGGYQTADPTGYINAVCRFATWGWLYEGAGSNWPLQLTRSGR